MVGEFRSPGISRESLDHWQLLKRDRMRQFIDYLREVGEVNKTWFLGQMGIEGFHRQTVLRYLADLQDAGLIRIFGDRIVWVGSER